ncbi:hypothetical protein HK104_005967, partial [Borealophlyctis nickersoniae]
MLQAPRTPPSASTASTPRRSTAGGRSQIVFGMHTEPVSSSYKSMTSPAPSVPSSARNTAPPTPNAANEWRMKNRESDIFHLRNRDTAGYSTSSSEYGYTTTNNTAYAPSPIKDYDYAPATPRRSVYRQASDIFHTRADPTTSAPITPTAGPKPSSARLEIDTTAAPPPSNFYADESPVTPSKRNSHYNHMKSDIFNVAEPFDAPAPPHRRGSGGPGTPRTAQSYNVITGESYLNEYVPSLPTAPRRIGSFSGAGGKGGGIPYATLDDHYLSNGEGGGNRDGSGNVSGYSTPNKGSKRHFPAVQSSVFGYAAGPTDGGYESGNSTYGAGANHM